MARLTLILVALLAVLVATAHVDGQELKFGGRKMLQRYGIRADFAPAPAPAYKSAPVGVTTGVGGLRRLQQAYGIRSGEAPAPGPAYKDADVVSP